MGGQDLVGHAVVRVEEEQTVLRFLSVTMKVTLKEDLRYMHLLTVLKTVHSVEIG